MSKTPTPVLIFASIILVYAIIALGFVLKYGETIHDPMIIALLMVFPSMLLIFALIELTKRARDEYP